MGGILRILFCTVKILFPAEDTFLNYQMPSSLHVSSEKQVNALERIGKIKLASLWGRWLGVADGCKFAFMSFGPAGKSSRLFSLFPSSTLCVALSVYCLGTRFVNQKV